MPCVAPSLRSFLCTLRGPTPSGTHRCSETPVSTGEGGRPVPQARAPSQGTEPAGRLVAGSSGGVSRLGLGLEAAPPAAEGAAPPDPTRSPAGSSERETPRASWERTSTEDESGRRRRGCVCFSLETRSRGRERFPIMHCSSWPRPGSCRRVPTPAALPRFLRQRLISCASRCQSEPHGQTPQGPSSTDSPSHSRPKWWRRETSRTSCSPPPALSTCPRRPRGVALVGPAATGAISCPETRERSRVWLVTREERRPSRSELRPAKDAEVLPLRTRERGLRWKS